MDDDSLPDVLGETLAVFETLSHGGPLTTPEVTEALDIGRRGTYNRLDQLVERGHLDTKGVGARGRVWWQPEPTARDERRETPTTTEASFKSLVDAVEGYAIFLLDQTGRIATWNAGATRIKGYERTEIVGEPLATFYTEEDVQTGIPQQNLADAKEDGSVEDEGWRVRKDGSRFWAAVTITAVYDDAGDLTGYAKVTRDMTEQHELDERLRRQRDTLETEMAEIFERVDDAFFALDEDWVFTYVNDRAADVIGLSVGEMLGTTVWETLPEIAEGRPRRLAERAMEDQKSVEFEFHSTILDNWIEVRAFPSESGLSVYFRDITVRKERERELERYETIVETVGDGIYIVDGEGRFTMLNGAYAEMVGYTRDQLLGSHVSRVVEEETVEAARQYEAELLAGDRDTARIGADLVTADGETVQAEATFAILAGDDGEIERVAVVRDVTERVERERELEQYRTIVETVDDGIYVLDEEYHFRDVNDAYVEMTGYDRETLLGAHCSMVVGEAVSRNAAERSHAMSTGDSDSARIEAPILRADGTKLQAESKFTPLVREEGTVQGTVGVVRDMTDRVTRERSLEQQRERLAALDNLNTVVREIIDTVIDQSTREEIERTTCDLLTATGSYEFVWIGDIDSSDRSVFPRASAGATDFFEGATIPIEPDDPRTTGTIGRAVRTQEIEVTTDVDRVFGLDGWPDLVQERGLQSAAAIPIEHQGTLYGVLNAYATRAGAFQGEELEVIGGLGEVIGHAIAALERKRALMSDEVIELEFQLLDFGAVLDIDVPDTGRVELDQAVPLGDDDFLVYGTANADGIGVVRAVGATLPHWQEVTTFDETSVGARFQARLSEPPILASVAALGGQVDVIVLEDGDIRMCVHLVPGTEIRQVADVVRASYPTAEMVSRRQLTRPGDTAIELHRSVLNSLTDRQRAVLAAAFNSGFFEQPRLRSGEDIAGALEISAATFHRHLRSSTRKLIAGVLGISE